MATLTTNAPYSFSPGPFALPDIAVRGLQFLQIADMVNCTQVSKTWNTFVTSLSIWSTLYDNDKLPPIEGRGVETKMVDYLFMSSRTCGAKQAKCLGEFVGIVPAMSAKIFQLFKTAMDPYEPNKKMSDTWVVVVEPTHIHRSFDQALLDDLVKDGDSDAKAPEKSDLTENREYSPKASMVPYSLQNLKILAEYPLAKKGEGPVFADMGAGDGLNVCSTISKTVKVTLMRKEGPKASRNLSYPDQKELLKKEGHVLVPLCTRAYFDVLEILNNNTCPDNREPEPEWKPGWTFVAPQWIFVRTSTEHQVGNRKVASGIGGFAPGDGVQISLYHDYTPAHYAACPAVPAEVLDIGPDLAPSVGQLTGRGYAVNLSSIWSFSSLFKR